MRTLLFDIDGTLLLTNRGGNTALKLALEQEFGVPSACTNVSFSGRTDRSLLPELLERNKLSGSIEFQERLRQRYASLFPEVLSQRGGKVLPGAERLLERLSQRPDLLCCVMTGNLRETATAKLDHFGLLHYFHGVFGGEHDKERTRLAERTANSLREDHGEDVIQDIVVIGDTPADIRCGHAIGAKVVAVCTGNYGREALEAEGPLSVHDDLSDVSAVFELLAGPGPV